ncbi:MAG: hypothetical protein AAFV95_05130 [Bacteroidota bacterium]
MNDLTTVLEEGEADLLLYAQGVEEVGQELPLLLGGFYKGLYQLTGLQLFWLRLPAGLFLTFSFVFFVYFGREIFGPSLISSFILVSLSTWLLGNLPKFALSDAWLLGIQMFNLLGLLLALKKSSNSWMLLFFGSLLLGLALQPVQMLLFSSLAWGLFYAFHPQGRQLPLAYLWLAALVFLGVGLQLSWFGIDNAASLVHASLFQFKNYGLLILVGLFPWMGFVPAALWDGIQKWRKSEEMALILGICLLAALLSQSLMVVPVLSLMIARQLNAYLLERYPYKDWVRAGVLLTIVLSFCIITVGMINSFYGFQAVGYRSAMAAGATFWVFSFLGALGLFSQYRQMIHAGFSMAGLLFSFLFWIQLNPILEQHRAIPRGLVLLMDSLPEAKKPIVWDLEEIKMDRRFKLYRQASPKAMAHPLLLVDSMKMDSTSAAYRLRRIPAMVYDKPSPLLEKAYKARRSLLGEEIYILID